MIKNILAVYEDISLLCISFRRFHATTSSNISSAGEVTNDLQNCCFMFAIRKARFSSAMTW